MKKTITSILAAVFFLALSSANTLAQDFIHVTIEEVSNPSAYTRTGHFRRTSDGGYVAAATRGDGDYARAVIVKMNRNFDPERAYVINFSLDVLLGNERWQESYGADVIQTDDNEFVLLAAVNMNQWMVLQPGSQNLDFALIKLRLPAGGGNAEIVWAKRCGGDYNDTPQSMERTHDGGFIVSGYSNPEQALNLPTIALTLLARFDQDGNLQWARRYRNTALACNTGGFQLIPSTLRRPVIQTQGGGFVFSVHCDENAYIAKVDEQGDPVWVKRFEAGSGMFDGFFNPDWNFGLGIGAGTGGTVIGIRETQDGRLAFLGNQFAFFASIWGNPAGGDGFGLALPLSYLFTTDANGNFLNGVGFFRERWGDTEQPIEMCAQDFQPLPNGNLAVAAGTLQNCFSGPDCSYAPSLLEIDPAQTGFDEAIVRATTLRADLPRHFSDHYPFGLDFIRVSSPDAEGTLEMSYSNRFVRLHQWVSAPDNGSCLAPLAGMHSFPFTLQLETRQLSLVSLSSGNLNLHSASSYNFSRDVQCSVATSTEGLTAPSYNKLMAAPSVSQGRFNIISRQPEWIGAIFEILDLTGRLHFRGVILSERHEVVLPWLPSGTYVIRAVKDARQVVLRVVIVK